MGEIGLPANYKTSWRKQNFETVQRSVIWGIGRREKWTKPMKFSTLKVFCMRLYGSTRIIGKCAQSQFTFWYQWPSKHTYMWPWWSSITQDPSSTTSSGPNTYPMSQLAEKSWKWPLWPPDLCFRMLYPFKTPKWWDCDVRMACSKMTFRVNEPPSGSPSASPYSSKNSTQPHFKRNIEICVAVTKLLSPEMLS